MFSSIKHKLSHLFGINKGKVASWQEDGFIYVGFECDCGKIDTKTIQKIESKLIYDRANQDNPDPFDS